MDVHPRTPHDRSTVKLQHVPVDTQPIISLTANSHHSLTRSPLHGCTAPMAGSPCRRLPLFFLLLSVALLPPGGSSPAAAAVPKVSLALYYESLCPYCSRFIVNHLAGIFENGLIDAVDLRLVPYGNAHVRSDNEISCQHGPDECLLNTVEACAIDAWPDLNVHFGFINCVEDLVMKQTHNEWASCFEKLGLDPKPVTECYKSEHGHKLSLKYGKQTDALVPPHKYVPWVVVDGQPLYDDYENFEAYICKAYKGHPPKVCEGLGHHYLIVQEVVEAGNGVSYNSGDIKLDRADDDNIEDKIKMVLADDEN